jgi:hypothetical protein
VSDGGGAEQENHGGAEQETGAARHPQKLAALGELKKSLLHQAFSPDISREN